jgi:alcohol dehydrogenase (cytochrome c)
LIWQFNLIPHAGEVGASTWDADSADHGGGGTWTSYALDTTSREVFIPVGNPAPDFNSDSRIGANLFTNSLVVLDADTGKLKWWYQLSPHDDRDHDLSAPPVLFRMGSGRSAVALGSKNGYVIVLDRQTHKLLYKTAVTTMFNAQLPVRDAPTKVCPGQGGGVEWNGPAYDPRERSLIVGAVDWCAVLRNKRRNTSAEGFTTLGTFSWLMIRPRADGSPR